MEVKDMLGGLMFDGRYHSECNSVFLKNVSTLLSPQYGKVYNTVCAEGVYVYFWKVGVAHIYCTRECVFNISLLLMWKS